ncbi:hypothetical protein BMS3Bbin10_02955 [bacterium BMS3Bbin10]|nr:hypothetical protein BMS3Bbin10_02955 [bacterium BMS3Bbin10]
MDYSPACAKRDEAVGYRKLYTRAESVHTVSL